MTPKKLAGHALIVEPNDITRKLLAGILAGSHYDVYEARSGEEARAHLRHDLQVVIVDVENDDPSLAGILHKLQLEKNRVLIIVIADDADAGNVAARLRLKKVSVLQKPVLPEKLAALIAAHEGAGDIRPGVSGKYVEHDAGILKQRAGFMSRAIDIAQEKMDAGCGGPFGAVVVKSGKIIGEGWNAVLSTCDPTAHAEIMALRHASQALRSEDLSGCEVYASCEPCPMCMAAMYWARIDRVFYACTREDAQKIGFDDEFIYREMAQPEHKRSLSSRMFMREDSMIVFDNWIKRDKRA